MYRKGVQRWLATRQDGVWRVTHVRAKTAKVARFRAALLGGGDPYAWRVEKVSG
jgi:hypothetical protein